MSSSSEESALHADFSGLSALLKWFLVGVLLAGFMALSPDWLRFLFAVLLFIWAIAFPFIFSWSLVDLSSWAFLASYYGLSEHFARLGTRVDKLVLPLMAVVGLSESPLALFNRLNLANALMINGRFADALAVLKELDLSGASFAPIGSAFMPLVLSHMASAEHYLGLFDEATAHLKQSMTLKKSRLLRKDLTESEREAIELSQAADIYSLACFYEKLGDIELAKATFEEALEALRRIDIDVESRAEMEASFSNSLGDLLLRLDEVEAGGKLIEVAYRLRTEVLHERLNSKHPVMAASYENLGRLELARKNFAKAEKWLHKAYGIRLKTSKYNTADLADTERSLAQWRHSLGESDRAYELLKEALKHKESVFGESYPDVAEVLETFLSLGLGTEVERAEFKSRAEAIRKKFHL